MSLEIFDPDEKDRNDVVTRFYWRSIIDNEPADGSTCFVLYYRDNMLIPLFKNGVIKVKEYHDGMFYPRTDPNEGFYCVAFCEIDGYVDLLLGYFPEVSFETC